MFRKNAGDMIAHEMSRLLKIAQESKKPQADDADCAMTDDAKDKMPKSKEDHAEDFSAASFITEDNAYDHTEDEMDKAMDSVSDYADDEELSDSSMDAHASDRNVKLMKGLGKIEASLRRKGESFAADLVMVTAGEIKQEIIKEARQKEYVKTNLTKMAARLVNKGEKRAAAMVRDTILKISK